MQGHRADSCDDQDQCEPAQALLCTSDTGTGDSNVVYVTQSMENGQLRFNGLDGSGALQDHVWVGAEVGATCRLVHSIEHFWVDDKVDHTDLDGPVGPDASGPGAGVAPAFPTIVDTPDARTMPNKMIAVNVPIVTVFERDLTANYPDQSDVLARGEQEIADRLAAGMSAADARGTGFRVETLMQLSAVVHCRYNGVVQAGYFKRTHIHVPLRIDFQPAEVAPPGSDA